jgi:hypothetical protein
LEAANPLRAPRAFWPRRRVTDFRDTAPIMVFSILKILSRAQQWKRLAGRVFYPDR